MPELSTQIPDKVYFRIGEVARLLGVKTYVLRYWETEFPMVSPEKSAANQRVYRRSEVETLFMIRKLLYEEKYSIDGARKRLRALRSRPEPAPRAAPAAEKLERLRELAQELGRLAQAPISRLFHL